MIYSCDLVSSILLWYRFSSDLKTLSRVVKEENKTGNNQDGRVRETKVIRLSCDPFGFRTWRRSPSFPVQFMGHFSGYPWTSVPCVFLRPVTPLIFPVKH